MIKVLHVVGGMDIGGTETMLMNLYRNIDRDRYQFHFISYYEKEGFYDREIESLGGKIIHLKFSKRFGALGSILQLRKVIKEEGYDVVHTHTLFNCGIGVLSAWLGKAKVRISHAHTVFEARNNFIKKCYIEMMKLSIKLFSTHFLSCSNKAGEFLFGEKVLKDKNYYFIPNYVDYRKYLNLPLKKSLRELSEFKDDEIVIGHVGRFIEPKNHDFILDILKEIKSRGVKVKGLFVGDGDCRKAIEEKIKRLSLENDVFITGMVSNPEKYSGAMDIFLLPSKYEGFGLVLIEAQAARVKVIASTAVQEETDLGIGLLDRYSLDESAEFWSNKILEAYENRVEISKASVEKAFKDKGYSLDDIVQKLNYIYGGER
ncbi:glycosyltransferase family 1 protein [Cetobacterium sp.]|uniref:glycosyltransferase family 1 protein n=1 Tax=Cetobacterium sp. TaxID=2071632 RepID=UPI003F2AD860